MRRGAARRPPLRGARPCSVRDPHVKWQTFYRAPSKNHHFPLTGRSDEVNNIHATLLGARSAPREKYGVQGSFLSKQRRAQGPCQSGGPPRAPVKVVKTEASSGPYYPRLRGSPTPTISYIYGVMLLFKAVGPRISVRFYPLPSRLQESSSAGSL